MMTGTAGLALPGHRTDAKAETDMNKTKYSDIIYSRKGGVALLTIDRPEKLNAMSTTTISELSRAVMEADADREIRVIVLTGSGGKAFSAGFDIINVGELSVMESRRLHIRNSALNKALMETGKPVMAAVNGMALGAGFETSLLCDLTVAAESATFGMPELAIGAYPGSIAPALLRHIVGVKKANELLLTCRRIDAREAARLGLVNEVVPDATLLERTLHLAGELTGMAPLPLTMFKTRTNGILRSVLEEEINWFAEAQTLVFDSLDFREGMNALKEKRKPVFRGR